jgi:hypothetical protein
LFVALFSDHLASAFGSEQTCTDFRYWITVLRFQIEFKGSYITKESDMPDLMQHSNEMFMNRN